MFYFCDTVLMFMLYRQEYKKTNPLTRKGFSINWIDLMEGPKSNHFVFLYPIGRSEVAEEKCYQTCTAS